MPSARLDSTWVEVPPRDPPLHECDFYHTVELPSGDTIHGQWDLRATVDAYLGQVAFAGRTVLEIGPASGFLTFHMERRGATVTAVEPSMARLWDCVPMPGIDGPAWRRSFRDGLERVRNSFWYLHRLHGSTARVIEADPELLSPEIGMFDVGVLASVLLHCRSPFSILEGTARHVASTLIVTDLHDVSLGTLPVCRFIPDIAHKQIDTWWALTPAFVVSALAVLGFARAHVTTHHHRRDIDGQMVPLFTVVAARTEPPPLLPVRSPARGLDLPAVGSGTLHAAASPTAQPPAPPAASVAPRSLAPLLADDWTGPFAVPQRLGVPSSWWGHVPFAAWLVQACQPRCLVELGLHDGVSYAAFCEAVARHGLLTRCFGIADEPGSLPSDGGVGNALADILTFNQQHYSEFSQVLHGGARAVIRQLDLGSVDVLHLAGAPTYEALRHALDSCQPYLSAGAVVLLAGTTARGSHQAAHRLFAELSQEYPSFEFLHGNGLGVLACGAAVPEPIQQLCGQTDAAQTAVIRARFARLGAIWMGYARDAGSSPSVPQPPQAPESVGQTAAPARDGDHHPRPSSTAQPAGSATNPSPAGPLSVGPPATPDDPLMRENARLTQRLGDLQLDLAAQQRTQAQEVQAYAQVLADLLRRHADEVGFNAAGFDPHKRPSAPSLVGWMGRLLPRSLASLLQSQRPLLHWLLVRTNPMVRVIERSALFDADWYLAAYPSVAALKANAAYHYFVIGSRLGYDPGPWFSTERYLKHNPDVAEAGINALYHYEIEGRRAGRTSGVHVTADRAGAAGPEAEPLAPARVPDSNAAPAPSVSGPTAVDARRLHLKQARRELASFLSDAGSVLEFPAVDQPVLSIVIVVYNQAELTYQCLRSIREAMDVPLEIIVIDNASTDTTAQLTRRLSGCVTQRQTENLHFLRGANLGARQARGRHLLFLNNDTVVRPGALATGTRLLDEDPSVGAVGGQILLPDGTLQEAGSIIWQDGSTKGYGRGNDPLDPAYQFRRDVDYCSGVFLMVRREVFDDLGGFDPLFSPAYYEDADLCMRIWGQGLRVVYTPAIQVTHVESASYGGDGEKMQLMADNRERFRCRHLDALRASHLRPHRGDLQGRSHAGSWAARVLLIDDDVPDASAGSGFPRALELLKGLCRRDLLVTHFSTSPANRWARGRRGEVPDTVEYVLGNRDQLTRFLHDRRGYYQMVVVSRPHNMELVDAYLHQWPQALSGASVVYDAEAVASLRDTHRTDLGANGDAPVSARASHLSQEISLSRRADTVLAVSATEADIFRRHGRSDVRVLGHRIVPQAHEVAFRARSNFLFVGRLMEIDSPNADSIRWFLQDVMPLVDLRLGQDWAIDIVGLCASQLASEFAGPRVRFHGQVDDLAPFYSEARVFVAPTRFAAGVPLKVYEAAARGVPVVATELLGRQLGWAHATELLVASDATAFADACVRLYREEATWTQIRAGALQRVRLDCDPARFQATLDGVVADALARAGAHRAPDQPSRDTARTQQEWSRAPEVRTQEQGMFWMTHPVVAERINLLVSGDRQVGVYPHLLSVLRARGWRLPVRRAASLGSGFGGLERELVALGLVDRVDGFDLSEAAVAEARRAAVEAGMTGLAYRAADLEQIEFDPEVYDIVLACHSAHHIDGLDRLFAQVRRALKPGGVFHLQEYVGPDRFQWTDTQLAGANQFSASLPPRYLRLPKGEQRQTLVRPAVADVVATDPSEAVRSSAIIEAVQRHFTVIELRGLGGGLLHNALCGIAQNFDPTKEPDRDYLHALFDLEDRWMAEGRIQSDFAVITAIRE